MLREINIKPFKTSEKWYLGWRAKLRGNFKSKF